MKIKNITVAEYAALTDAREYDILLGSTLPTMDVMVKEGKSFVQIKPRYADVWDCNYGEIIALKTAFASGDEDEIVRIVFEVMYGVKDIAKVSIFSIANIKWVSEAFEELLKIEEQELAYEPSAKEKQAGIERLARFGHAPAIDSLTGGDLTKEGAYLAMPYHKIFLKMCLNRTNNDIQTNLYKNVGK